MVKALLSPAVRLEIQLWTTPSYGVKESMWVMLLYRELQILVDRFHHFEDHRYSLKDASEKLDQWVIFDLSAGTVPEGEQRWKADGFRPFNHPIVLLCVVSYWFLDKVGRVCGI